MEPKYQVSRDELENRLIELQLIVIARFPTRAPSVVTKAELKASYTDNAIKDLIRGIERYMAGPRIM